MWLPTMWGYILGTCTREAYQKIHADNCACCREDRRLREMEELEDGRFIAAVDMIGRCGAKDFQIRYDEEEPTVWMAVASFGQDGKALYEVDAALDPLTAALRLAERLVDGGTCTKCGRPSGLDPTNIETMPLNAVFCWYQFDPELRVFRRGCE